MGGGPREERREETAATGLPLHFLKHSGRAKPSRTERVLCASTLLVTLALLAAGALLALLVRHNRTQGKHLASHYNGWKVRSARCALWRRAARAWHAAR